MSNDINTWDYTHVAEVLLSASVLALEKQPNLNIQEKEVYGSAELFTDADVDVETHIRTQMQSQYPHNIIGEETFYQEHQDTDIPHMLQQSTIVIDPVDGTQNFVNKLPNWAVSIGHIQHNEFINGAITLPILGEMFISNEHEIHTISSQERISDRTPLQLTTYTTPTLTNHPNICYSTAKIYLAHLAKTPYKYQMHRSCVYSISKVISGSFFGFIGSANIWDFAACIGLFRAMGKPVYFYDKNAKTLEILPWTISEDHWVRYTVSRYPLVFALSYEAAKNSTPLATL